MTNCLAPTQVAHLFGRIARYAAGGNASHDSASYWALPRAAQAYVAGVITAGAVCTAWFLPATIDDPLTFGVLVALSCLTSAWKVTLPLSLNSGCTLSVSYAADLMALMLLGPHEAMLGAM